MTREDIAKSLKPLVWDVLVGDKYRFANLTEAHEAVIITDDDFGLLVKINRHGVILSEAMSEVGTMQEAMDFVREWQIDHFCSYFQMND